MSGKTTLLKIKKLHIWASGSMVDPYSNIWMDWKGRKNRVGREIGYRSVPIFLNISEATCSCSKEHKSSLRFCKYGGLRYEGKCRQSVGTNNLFYFSTSFTIDNSTPKWIKTLMSDYYSWKNWSMQFWGDNINEDGTFDPDWIEPKRHSFIKYEYWCWKRRRKIKLCNHPNMEVDSDISPESGSEDHFCPDCGFYQHIQYY